MTTKQPEQNKTISRYIVGKGGWICTFRITNPSINNCGLHDVEIIFKLFGFIFVKEVNTFKYPEL
jgi:hypothetical protein